MLSYNEFVQMLRSHADGEQGGELDEEEDDNGGDDDFAMRCVSAGGTEYERVKPLMVQELQQLAEEMTVEEQKAAEEERIAEVAEEEEVRQRKKLAEDELDRLQEGGRNPQVTEDSARYDFTRGSGSSLRPPTRMTSRGFMAAYDYTRADDVTLGKACKVFARSTIFVPVKATR